MSSSKTNLSYQSHIVEEYRSEESPYYLPVNDEIEIFHAAYEQKIPVLLKGPTGCGKTRFVEYMAHNMDRALIKKETPPSDEGAALPLVTIACHEDLSSSDLVGRYLLEGEETVWMDGPLTRAVKVGAICYLDEVVEARKDTTVLIHPLTDHRRILPIEKRGELIESNEGFLLVVSYNPGYQSALKDMKQSTRQRFISMEFGYPPVDLEAEVIAHESGVDDATANKLATLGEKARNLKEHGLQEGASTRLLIYAGKLMEKGIPARRACEAAVVYTLTDDAVVQRSLNEVVTSIFE